MEERLWKQKAREALGSVPSAGITFLCRYIFFCEASSTVGLKLLDDSGEAAGCNTLTISGLMLLVAPRAVSGAVFATVGCSEMLFATVSSRSTPAEASEV
mmetsp:Transcript_35495/g.62142  ORF Transcript_35495/g.62142 Transcript_35495/m.62142 type:complete len:100 (-) Transcript_35495:373-672(-)